MTDDNRPRGTRPTGPRRPDRRPSGKPATPRRPDAQAADEPRDDARIAKIMARAGLCSRRDAETWIAAGRVAVNGAVIMSPALNVGPKDRITIDGMPLPQREPTRLFLFHKPRGVVTTARDPEARQTIFDVLPEGLPRLVTVGRLDINTEGLMLLTNDGGLARLLELPATGWLRRYRARANGEIAQPALDALAEGLTIDGVDYAGIEARLDRVQGANAWLTLGLREGKNREIKRVLEHLGLAVTRLIRVSFGPFQLGEQPVGTVIEVAARVLRDQLGDTLARQAGLDLAERPQTERGPAGRTLPRPEPLRPVRPERPTPGARAHVSALRTARADEVSEGRRRTERGATADRKGRPVTVERVSSAAAKEADRGSRNGRRFSSEKDARTGGPSRLARPVRADAPARADTRPARADGRGTRPRHDRNRRDDEAIGRREGDAPRRRDDAGRRNASGSASRKPGGPFGGRDGVRGAAARSSGFKERPEGGLPAKPRSGGAPKNGGPRGGDRPQGGNRPPGGSRPPRGDTPRGARPTGGARPRGGGKRG